MSDDPRYFRLGLFVVMGAVILIAGIFIFGGGQMFRHKILFETYVDGSVQGVDLGTPVKFRGVQIGKVTEIGFSFTMYHQDVTDQVTNYVVIVMEVDREITPRMFDGNLQPALEDNIARGLRVRIQPQGITGLNFLDFGYVNPERHPPLQVSWKPRHLYVPYAPGELTSFLESINKIMEQVEDFNIQDLTGKADNLLANLNKAILEAKVEQVRADVEGLIAQASATLEDVQTTLGGVRHKLDEADIATMRMQAQSLIESLQKTTGRLDAILGNLEPVTRLNPQEIQQIVSNVNAVSDNLLELSEEVRRRPSLLLWGTPASGSGAEKSTDPAADPGETEEPDVRRSPRRPRAIPGTGPTAR